MNLASLARAVAPLAPLLPLLLAGACGDDLGEPPVLGGPPAGLVVVNSDFASTSVSLLDPAGGALTLAADDCINSGSVPPGLTLALSGDVVSPSEAQPGGELLLLDRSNDTLVWMDPRRCAVTREMVAGTTTFLANPHDVVGLSADKAYVLRYERNPQPTPAAADLDEGEDLLVINPFTRARLARIDLSGYATGGGAVRARPDRAVAGGGKVWVALGNLDQDFATAGPGRIVVVDPATDTVTGTVDIPGRKGCTGLRYLAAASRLIVSCAGVFSDGAAQADGSAVVAIDTAADPPVIVDELPASAFNGRPLSFSGIAPIDGARGLVVAFGDFTTGAPDELWRYDLDAGTASRVVTAGGPFVLGELLVLGTRAIVTDASVDSPRLRVLDVSTAVPTELASVPSNPARGLPPRSLARY